MPIFDPNTVYGRAEAEMNRALEEAGEMWGHDRIIAAMVGSKVLWKPASWTDCRTCGYGATACLCIDGVPNFGAGR